MRICGTLFIVGFTFPVNMISMIPMAAAIAWTFRRYIRLSRLFRRLSSATFASLNAFATENVNGAVTIRTFQIQEQVSD